MYVEPMMKEVAPAKHSGGKSDDGWYDVVDDDRQPMSTSKKTTSVELN